jgi:hypothetical protein
MVTNSSSTMQMRRSWPRWGRNVNLIEISLTSREDGTKFQHLFDARHVLLHHRYGSLLVLCELATVGSSFFSHGTWLNERWVCRNIIRISRGGHCLHVLAKFGPSGPPAEANIIGLQNYAPENAISYFMVCWLAIQCRFMVKLSLCRIRSCNPN